MNNEIKEILDYLKRSDKNKFGFEQGKLIDYEETQLLYNYITNLQQENERLKSKTKEQSLLLIDYQDMEQRYNDYKSRCEKASDKLKRDYYINYNEHNDDVVYEALNILQNGSEEK